MYNILKWNFLSQPYLSWPTHAFTVGVTTTAIPSFVQPAHAASKNVKNVAQEAPKKLSKEEKEFKQANSSLDLSKQTLKAYEKLSSDAKSADKKASSALESATKNAASAKKAYTTVSAKLAAAKSQKMPSSAIKELSADSGTRTRTTSKQQQEQYLSAASNININNLRTTTIVCVFIRWAMMGDDDGWGILLCVRLYMCLRWDVWWVKSNPIRLFDQSSICSFMRV